LTESFKKKTKFMKILLATDGSVHSNAAAEEIANRPFPAGTQVLIMSVFQRTFLVVAAPAPMGGLARSYEEADKIAQKHAEDAVKIASEIIKEKKTALSISTKVVIESAKEGILNEAETFDADLIVVGSNGQSALSRILIGSVSHAVALHADCSVEIVRKRGLEEETKES
jgi:nucleotide-binding universal stress UspA family protein